MPIYEFKCLKCEEFFEFLSVKSDEKLDLACPKCKSEEFERVLSTTSYSMSENHSGEKGASSQTRTCSGGSCTTYNIPGHTR
jgi:putative FmdB family regulatory protein